ncbi:hypothetical protein AB205_0195020 [Aquarana catesbeiana]|uniref:Uncharacterized protein n=1 Tax=Aquarana catesbeiana TaxID=8400 RepID=A0A2G9QLC5_AQUCT|nr:hypothetical protein AB205_0195020 [Aquarana catesbeiana]
MDPVMGTHQRAVPSLYFPGTPHRKIRRSLRIMRVKTSLLLRLSLLMMRRFT